MNIIQIGCNDCIGDDAYKLVIHNEKLVKKLLVIDALPKCVDAAKKAYSFLGERLTAVSCAVGMENKITNFFFPENDEMSPHASLRREHLPHCLHTLVNRISVPVLDINDVLRSFNDDVDWLFIDTEGFDALILLHLDLERYSPKNIYYEFAHTDGPGHFGKNHYDLIEKLKKAGYILQEMPSFNIIATRK